MNANFIKKRHLNCLLIFTMVVSSISAQNKYIDGLEQLHGVKISQEEGFLSKIKSKENLTLTGEDQIGFQNYRALEKLGVKYWLKESPGKDSGYEFYGHQYTGMNIPFASVIDANGNTYVTGAGSNIDSPEGNFVTIKIDTDGNRIWEAKQPGTAYSAVFGYAITLDKDKNPVATGTFWNGNNMDIQTIKYNAETGEVLWQSIFNGSAQRFDVPSVITTDANGNVIVAGMTYVENGVSYVILKYNANGNLLWSVTDQNKVADSWSEPTAVDVDASGNIAVTGYALSTDSYQHYYTLKCNAQGELIWKDLYNDESNATANSVARDVSFDTAGNCYVTGTFDKNSTDEIGTIKYSTSGEVLWVHTYKSGTDITRATAVKFFGSGIYISGYHYGDWTNDGLVLLSVDEDGNTNWVQESNDLIEITTAHLMLTSDNLPIIAGSGYDTNFSDTRINVLKYNENGSLLDNTSYLKPYSATASLSGFVDFNLDNSANVYLLLNATYSELGNVFETTKLSFSSSDPLWVNLYGNNGGSNTQLLNAITDQSNNTYVTSQYGTIENESYITNNTLIKYNDKGIIEWEKVFNSSNGNASEGIAVRTNNNGEVIVYLIPSSYEGDPLRIKKYNADGSLIWEIEKQMDTPSLYTFMVDSENSIYIAGSSFENITDFHAVFTVIKFSDAGKELWTAYKGSDNSSYNVFNINAGTINSAGDLVFTGAMGTGGFWDQNINMMLMKFSPSGSCLWLSSIEQSGFNSSGTSLLTDNANNIYINGFNQDKTTYEEKMVVGKFDNQGNKQWVSEYGETGRRVRSYDIKQFSNQHVVVSGFSVMEGVDNNVILVNYDTDGNQTWTQNTESLRFYKDMYLDGGDNLFVFNQVQTLNLTDRIYYSNSLMPLGGLFKVDASGTASEELFLGPELSMFLPNCLVPLNNGKILLAGEVAHEMNFFEGVYFFESTYVTGISENEDDLPKDVNGWLGQNYPNPVSNGITNIPFYLSGDANVELSIYDLQGRMVLGGSQSFFSSGNHVISVNVASLKQGLYMYKVKTNNVESSRIMIVK